MAARQTAIQLGENKSGGKVKTMFNLSGIKSEISFGDGIPDRGAICPEISGEYKTKKCADCVRFGEREYIKPGYACSMKHYDIDVFPEDAACEEFWSRERQEEWDKQYDRDIEKRREELWAVYAGKDPVKLPIVNDGYGFIPMCPACGEMPYSTEQCHWYGQRFIQDEQVEDYNKPLTEKCKCPNCGADGEIHIAKYNGHKSFHCEKCGMRWME